MTESILTLHNISLSRAENEILHNATINIKSGEFVYLIGRVGSGKSTLMKAIYADVPIRSGDARFLDYDLLKIKKKEIPYLRRKLGIIFQDFQLLTDRSVYKNLEFVLRATGWNDKKEIDSRIDEVLTRVGMQSKGFKMPHELSGGEQQRIVISRAILNHPALILADEPTGNLDPETSEQIILLLRDIAASGTAIMMCTHNYALVKKYPSRIIKIEDGRLLEMLVKE